ncbi:MAG TPA: SGNH/GDSL hydrolase family protein [Oculatellaceae cyanobacterium]
MPATFPPSVKESSSQADIAGLAISDVSISEVSKARRLFSCLDLRGHRTPAIAFSYALMAALGFVTLDAAKHRFPADRMARPEKSTIWWASNQYQKAAIVRRPDVVLLGSSLMIAAQNDCDATVYDESFDVLTHYHSQFLESELSKAVGHQMKTASFVIGGQMASDAYTIVKVLLSKQQREQQLKQQPTQQPTQQPKQQAKQNKSSQAAQPSQLPQQTIVWGIAPRDFIDATFSSPEETETVKLMSRLADDDNLLEQRLSFWKDVEQRLSRTFALYRDRDEMRAWQTDAVDRCLHFLMPAMFTPEMRAPSWLLHQAALSLPEDNKPGQWICRPFRLKGNDSPDNSTEYKSRYQPFKLELFRAQLDCFDATLREARERGAKVLVVNMPLMQSNLQLLPPGVYQRYLKAVQESAQLYDARFLDLNNGKSFAPADFCDPVHLNGNGARKFMQLVAHSLTQS